MNYLIILTAILASWTTKQVDGTCVVTEFEDVINATASCNDIIIGDLFVPAGQTLVLDLLDGASVTFRGNVTFGYVNWVGPLMRVYGSRVTVQGEEGHILNGQGELYWDSVGSWGTQKPKFMIVQVTNGSVFRNIHVYNAPIHGIDVNNSHDALFTNFLIDNAAGAENVAPINKSGHNTDGFGVNASTNIVIQDSVVFNQDDCVVLNSGSNIHVKNMLCHGSHGLSLSVGFSNTTLYLNRLTDAVIENCTIIDSMTGIHVKTHIDAGIGEITNVTYRNIKMIGSYKQGISVEQNYTNTNSSGNGAAPKNNIPIKAGGYSLPEIVSQIRPKSPKSHRNPTEIPEIAPKSPKSLRNPRNRSEIQEIAPKSLRNLSADTEIPRN